MFTFSRPLPPALLLAVLAGAQFMVVLDVTIVNVALPAIGADLGLAPDDAAWVVTAYALAYGGLLLPAGRAADALGRRATFAAGLALFTAASLACGLAESPAVLVGARIAQGVGAALLSPAALALVVTGFEGAARRRALAIWGAIGGAGAAAGVLLGGVLSEIAGWEAVFLVNVPIGLAVLALVPAVVPAAPAAGDRRLDLLGALLLTAGLASALYALGDADSAGWGSAETLSLAAAGGALLAAFALYERRVPAPLVPRALVRRRTLRAASAAMLVASGVLVAAFYLLSLQLQAGLGLSALETGLLFLPVAVAVTAGAHAGARLLPRHGARPPLVGGLLVAAAGLAALAAAAPAAGSALALLPGFLVASAGLGLAFATLTVTATAGVAHGEAGVASAVLTTAHELGAAIGVSGLASAAAASGGIASGDGLGAAFALAAAAAAATALAVAALVRDADVGPEALAERPAVALH